MKKKNAAAVELGKKGGKKGGKAKVPKGLSKLSAARRKQIASMGGKAKGKKKDAAE